MPSREDHLRKAKKNKEFADAIKSKDPTFVGWSLTAIFYSAMHYIEAFNARYHLHCKNHQETSQSVRENPLLEAIHDDYRDLSAVAWNARYQPVVYGEKELEEARECHAKIERHVSALIADGH